MKKKVSKSTTINIIINSKDHGETINSNFDVNYVK
jgi:hypothetical protein